MGIFTSIWRIINYLSFRCEYFEIYLAGTGKMKVAGRNEEIESMQEILSSDRAEFLAVYGRRRIGKTYLIRQVYEQRLVFECSGLHEKDMRQQLEHFWLTLTDAGISKKAEPPKTWLQAFSLLKQYINNQRGNKKKVIFLDEIAWFETPRSGFLSALDNFWNQFCSKRKDIILVICGSAASWIIDKVINNKGGLHNRVTQHIHLSPFTLGETQSYLEMNSVKLSMQDITTLYMCMGGVPYYLSFIKKGKSVSQILDELFFRPQAKLKNEFDNLYASLFKKSDKHVAIVKALATTNKGLTRNEIIKVLKHASGGYFSLVLQELTACDFVKAVMPINKNKEDILYRLTDEYSIFYFRFLAPTKRNGAWFQITASQSYKIWLGFAFENVCFKHILQIKNALGIGGIISKEYSWIEKGTVTEKGCQIDFIIDRADNCINLLELKYHSSLFEITKSYAAALINKKDLFINRTKSGKNVFITMLAANGVKKNEHYLTSITNEVELRDIFRPVKQHH